MLFVCCFLGQAMTSGGVAQKHVERDGLVHALRFFILFADSGADKAGAFERKNYLQVVLWDLHGVRFVTGLDFTLCRSPKWRPRRKL